ncbi:YwiC-like family protein [Streptomyces sp. NPDC006430]|uniref:YwiC-like family protein n=1 Tax=Streptomyces sp. NPDC006430 TaxID=3154299 RepID=UPI0033B7B11B
MSLRSSTDRPSATPARRRRRRQWVPPQHGAWAMLLVPYLGGLITAGFSWVQLPLLIAWTAGYMLSYFTLLAVKTHRLGKVREQVTVYGGVTLAAGLTVVIARPHVLLLAPGFAVALAVNGYFASARHDRALVNGLVSVFAAMLILPVVAVTAGAAPWSVSETFLVTLLYFTGSLLFVRTTIRERGNRTMLAVSVGFHVAALVVATALSPLYAIAFAAFLVRAALLPRRPLTPKQIGLVEMATSALLLGSVAFAA